jgi:hypothetical protein
VSGVTVIGFVLAPQLGFGPPAKLLGAAYRCSLPFPHEFGQPRNDLGRGARLAPKFPSSSPIRQPCFHGRLAIIGPPGPTSRPQYGRTGLRPVSGLCACRENAKEAQRPARFRLPGSPPLPPCHRPAEGASQPWFTAWRTMSTRLRNPSFSMARALNVSTVFTLRLSWAAISLLA